MLSFSSFLKEETQEGGAKLKHIHHAEDRPIFHGAKGFEHAKAALKSAHDQIKSGSHSSHLTMKYDGSPSIVFGHHPETGKFFVASKSAFNKTPKINYNEKDIEKNHGHAPGLVAKLKDALHLKKVAPKKGVYQGDVMFGHDDKHEHKGGVSFTPNTIKYTAKGDEAEKIKKAKVGVVVHTQYHGKNITDMKADPHPDVHNFKQHGDVWHKSAEHDTSKVKYSEKSQNEYKKHMDAAEKIHEKHGSEIYKATEPHRGETGHLSTYINHTVRTDEVPSAKGLMKHIAGKYKKEVSKLKTPVAQSRKETELTSHLNHIEGNANHYNNLLKMQHHIQQAKNVLVDTLNQHEGGLEHHIDSKVSKPEGFVVHHAGEPTKLVNRAEFAKANLLKVRK